MSWQSVRLMHGYNNLFSAPKGRPVGGPAADYECDEIVGRKMHLFYNYSLSMHTVNMSTVYVWNSTCKEVFFLPVECRLLHRLLHEECRILQVGNFLGDTSVTSDV